MLDQAMWKAAKFSEHGVRFVPAINEELGATQVLGTQRVESDPSARSMACSPCGTARARAWTAPATRSSTATPTALAAWRRAGGGRRRPRLRVVVDAAPERGLLQAFTCRSSPGNVAEYLEFGLYGWALSRYSGNWVGLTALSEVVESGATVDLDALNARRAVAGGRGGARRHRPPAAARRPALPLARPASLRIESRLADKLARWRLRARQPHRPRAHRRAPRGSASSPAARRITT
jgi:indolepyruvate ferredoxin oxidoreductase